MKYNMTKRFAPWAFLAKPHRKAAGLCAWCFATVATGFLLAACSILPETEPTDTYLLPTELQTQRSEMPDHASSVRGLSLRINQPAAGERLGGQRIIVLPQPNQMQVYQGVRWSERATVLLRNRLFDAFRQNGSIMALSTDERNLQAEYELVSELRAFQSEYREGARTPQVVVALDMRLVRTRDRRIVASRRFESVQAAADTAVPGVVQAFGKASDNVAVQVVAWALPHMQPSAAE